MRFYVQFNEITAPRVQKNTLAHLSASASEITSILCRVGR